MTKDKQLNEPVREYTDYTGPTGMKPKPEIVGANIISKIEPVLCHYKDGELVAITHSNGKRDLYKTVSMNNKDIEDFYEANAAKY